MSADASMEDTGTRRSVGYIVTHYPKLAQTFIAAEVEAVEQVGQPICMFAMNSPEDGERKRSGAEAKIARTAYLKPALPRGVALLVWYTLTHPMKMRTVWRKAIASASGSPSRIIRRLAHLAQAALVAREAERAGIERLHAHFGLAPATIAWLATGIARVRGRSRASFSFTIHGYHDFFDPAESRLDLKAAEADAVFCISDFTKSQLCLTTEPGLWEKFHVTRCGIDLDAFAYRDPPSIDGRLKVVALGRLSAEKGFAILLEAMALLRGRQVEAELRIIGDGPLRPALAKQIGALGLSTAVTLAGELPPDAVRRELADADVFCMASFNEGLPISIMEAMAIGVPVVTTWIAGIPELAREGETALTVPPANAERLAKAIEQLVRDDDLRLKLARTARRSVESLHELRQRGREVAGLLQSARD